jgi:putative intracellular protease/amidase
MIAANPAVSPVTGWPIGFWWAELTHPYFVFQEAGYAIDIVSPQGGDLVPDGYSDPEDASGYSAHDFLSLGFKKSPAHAALLKGTRKLSDIATGAHDAIFLVGGQSPMVTMIDDEALHRFVVKTYEAGKIVAAVCHATCVLLRARGSNGDLLVAGKTWTGFANSEEAFADSFVGKRIQPFWIEEEARKIAGTNFVVHNRFEPFAVRDGNLITGQQQNSGAAAARLVVEALGR